MWEILNSKYAASLARCVIESRASLWTREDGLSPQLSNSHNFTTTLHVDSWLCFAWVGYPNYFDTRLGIGLKMYPEPRIEGFSLSSQWKGRKGLWRMRDKTKRVEKTCTIRDLALLGMAVSIHNYYYGSHQYKVNAPGSLLYTSSCCRLKRQAFWRDLSLSIYFC